MYNRISLEPNRYDKRVRSRYNTGNDSRKYIRSKIQGTHSQTCCRRFVLVLNVCRSKLQDVYIYCMRARTFRNQLAISNLFVRSTGIDKV